MKTRRNIHKRGALASATLVAVGLLAAAAPSVGAVPLAGDGPAPSPAPNDGVLFGDPSAGTRYVVFDQPTTSPENHKIVAQYRVGTGFVRFVDEGDSVSTIIKGDRRMFSLLADARTVGNLFELAAPPNEEMPPELEAISDDVIDELVADQDKETQGIELESELSASTDDWADECDEDEHEQWRDSFNDWHDVGPVLAGDDFIYQEHLALGADPDPVFGYYSTLDEIWLGVCMVKGTIGVVEIDRYSFTNMAPDGQGWGSWQTIVSTSLNLSPGERYLNHNHSHYGPMRRAEIRTIGEAGITGQEFFISAAGQDTFAPDDQLSS